MPTLYVLQGPDRGRTFHTSDEPTILGRNSDQVPLTDNSISRRHARLTKLNGHWGIEDCNSSNGTFLNGSRIHEPAPIKHGDQIRLAGTLLVFTGGEALEDFTGKRPAKDLVELGDEDRNFDSSILASAAASEESVILASPETSDAVHAWNIIYQIAESIGTFISVNDFLQRMTDIVFELMPVDRIFVLMREDQADELQPRVVRFKTPADNDNNKPKITTSRRIVNHVIRAKEGVLCANAQTDDRFGEDTSDSSIHRLGLRSVICVPILTREQVVGVIHLDCNMADHTYSQQQLHLVTTIGRMAGMAIENARLIESRVRHERLAAVGETVASLSHGIRNILQGMRSGADVIELGLRGKNLDNVGAGWQIVQRNLERTYRLATNMLSFSKQRQPHIEMAPLNPIIDDVVALVQRQADDKGVMLLTDLDELPPIPLDVDGIHQVVTNVVINAIDAVQKDSGRVLVNTRFDADTSIATIIVSDNGPGVAKGDLERIFDAFHSTKGHGGTGLGLAAAKKIVEELGGTIDVTSSAEGTVFTIRITSVRGEEVDSGRTHGPPE